MKDVYEALRSITGDIKTLELSEIKSMRKAYGGTQISVIAMSSVR